MAKPEYTVTVTITTVDQWLAQYARNEGENLVRYVEERVTGDRRPLLHTSVDLLADLDPGGVFAMSHVEQFATVLADELERRRRLPDPDVAAALTAMNEGVGAYPAEQTS
jgi:hypothetical protein